MWRWSSLAGLWRDARYALRGMRRSPGFTAVAVASLALGIGANTAIFSLMETVMLRALPVSHPEQLVELLQKYPGEPRGGYWSWQDYEHFRDNNHVFSALIGSGVDNLARIRIEESAPETRICEFVSGNYFPVLGVKPTIGRLIVPDDVSTSTAGDVAVVNWTLWTTRFHQDPGILGKQIVVENVPATIIGVAPSAFAGLRIGARTDVWVSQRPEPAPMGAMLGRLKPGATIEQVRAEIPLLYQFTIEERAANSKDPQIRQLSVQAESAGNGLSTVRDRFGKPLTVLMTVVGLLLLLACVNTASMLLARAAGREREMALRTSLGAGRGRLLRQVLTESLMLSAMGTLVGAFLAYFGSEALVRILATGRAHERVFLPVEPNMHVLLFAAGIAVLAGLLFGLAPALSAFRAAPAFALRQTGRAGDTRIRRLFGRGLVAIQVALSVLLLSAAGLFIAHLSNLEQTDLGFRRDHVLLVSLDPSRSGYSGERMSSDYRELLHRLEAIPGVRSVSLSAPTPLSGAGASGFGTFEGYQERPQDRRWISISWVGPKYFETLGTPLLAGRSFSSDEPRSRVAIINQTLARYYFADANPIGKHVTLFNVTLDPEPKSYEIVGVAGDANYYEIREPARRAIYLPAFHDGRVGAQTFVVRTGVTPESAAADVRRVIHEVLPSIPVTSLTTLTDQIDASIVPERLIATLSGFFGVLGALLAGIGLYGLLAYTVARRTNEIGIRLALGATSGKVTRMVLGDALAMVVAGLVLGVPMAVWGRSLAATVIQDITIETRAPLAVGVVVMVGVALLAAYIPARRAASVDPMEALRQE